MRGMYTAAFSAVTASATQDAFEITAPAAAVVVIHQLILTQHGIADYGDAQDEGVQVLLKRGSSATTSGSGGSAVTPAKTESGTGAAGSSVEANNTTKMSGGTITTLHVDTFNVRAGYSMLWTPETRLVLSPGERLTCEITAPNDALTLDGTLYFEEIGG